MSGRRGSGLVEALAATALAAVAFAGLAASVLVAVRALRHAEETARALVAAADAQNRLRVGEPLSGADAVGANPALQRQWTAAAGRGLPAATTVEIAWGARSLRVESSTWR